jgi:hypothetical protein
MQMRAWRYKEGMMQRDLRVMVLDYMYVWRKQKGYAAFGHTEIATDMQIPTEQERTSNFHYPQKMVLLEI